MEVEAQPVETRGQRLGQARRLMAFALAQDINQTQMAALLGISSTTWNRWESDEDRPRDAALAKITALFIQRGMPYMTAAWIEYGVEGKNFPHVVTDMIEVAPALPDVPSDPVESARSAAKTAPSRAKKSGGRGR